MSDEVRLVLTTAPDLEVARRIVRGLVEAGACACGTILPGATSIYRWQGVLEEAAECQVVLKCSQASLGRLQECLSTLHPYELPEVIVLDPVEVEARYAQWVVAQCAAPLDAGSSA
jgi:periplasmic divalent cation tolerance protein